MATLNQSSQHSYLGLYSSNPATFHSMQAQTGSPRYSPASLPPSPSMHQSHRSLSPYLSSADRDFQTQQRLLGYDAWSTSPASPSHHFRPTSPLSEASNLEDSLDAELDSDRSPVQPDSLVLDSFARPALVRNFSSLDCSEDELGTPPPSSALGLAFSAPNKPLSPIIVEEIRTRTRAASPQLPTIRESTYPYGGTLFPHAPHPPAPEPFKPREQPSPHIVDIAIETYGLPRREPFVIYTPPSSPPSQPRRKSWSIFRPRKSIPQPAAEEEKQPDMWAIWDAERLRAAEMTREAAKDNYPEWQYPFESPTPEASQENEENPISRVSSGSHQNDDCSMRKGSRFIAKAASRMKILSRRERS